MAVPELTAHGLLPLGVHEASLEEVMARFGTANARRILLGDGLTRFVQLVKEIATFGMLYIDGSFTTDKELPGDVDVVLQVPAVKKSAYVSHPRRSELHPTAVKAAFHVHLFVEAQELGPSGMASYFQRLKTEECLARKLAPTHRRGIIKVRL